MSSYKHLSIGYCARICIALLLMFTCSHEAGIRFTPPQK
jgi:hypothetical protein